MTVAALAVKNNFSSDVITKEQLNETVSLAAIIKSEIIRFPAVAVVPIATLTVAEVAAVLQNKICLTIDVVAVGTKYRPVVPSVTEVTAAEGPNNLFCINAISTQFTAWALAA